MGNARNDKGNVMQNTVKHLFERFLVALGMTVRVSCRTERSEVKHLVDEIPRCTRNDKGMLGMIWECHAERSEAS